MNNLTFYDGISVVAIEGCVAAITEAKATCLLR